jgi:GAF domain-containing protein/HAMP domain-containing protein
MKIYSKILLVALPLIIIPAVVMALVSYDKSRNEIRSMAQESLRSYLTNAIGICTQQSNTLKIKGEMKSEKISEAQSIATSEIGAVTFDKTGYLMVVDANGTIIAHPEQKYLNQNFSTESWFRNIKGHDQGTFTFTLGGEKRLANFQRFQDWDWYVISTENEVELLGSVSQLGTYIGGLLALSLLIALIAILIFTRWIIAPIQALVAGTEQIQKNEPVIHFGVTTNDEIGILAKAFNNMTGRLEEANNNLEQRVTERTQKLEHRTLQLQTASEIVRVATSTHDLNTLLDQSVTLIQERFGFYHVGIYTPDERKQYAVLRAGSGEVGKLMVQRGYRVRIGEVGIISYVAGTGEPRMVNDVNTDFTYIKNPLLPDTACATALPLKANDQVIGILDIESQHVNGFTQDMIAVLQSLAGQLAIAMENARMFGELRNSLQETRTLYQQNTQDSWARTTQENITSGYQFDLSQITTYTRDLPDDIRSHLLEGKVLQFIDHKTGGDYKNDHSVVQSDGNDRSVMVAPLIMRNQLIGVLGVETENLEYQWSPEEAALLESISNQVAMTLENARLLEETQRRGARDRMVADIANKMRRAVDMDTLIQTAVREITKAVNVPEAFVQLGLQTRAQDKEEPQPLHKQESSDPNLDAVGAG